MIAHVPCEGINPWMARVKKQRLRDEPSLRVWLTKQGITGYAQSLLVMERFGYPDFVLATAAELIDNQYADRPNLRRIYDALIAVANAVGPLTLQARKTYVSLVSPRRTFARIVPATRHRVDLGLRLPNQKPVGRLVPSSIHETMRLQIGLSSLADVDSEVRRWLTAAYVENC